LERVGYLLKHTTEGDISSALKWSLLVLGKNGVEEDISTSYNVTVSDCEINTVGSFTED
jgi:hypothetical protein